MEESASTSSWVTVYDLLDSYHNTNVTALWSPYWRTVVFIRDWHDVPDMPASEEPTEEQVKKWAEEHGWKWPEW